MRKRAAILLVTVVVAAVVAPIQARADDPITVTIRFRHPGAICAGYCPHFETQVADEGIVTTRDLWTGKTTQFKVSEEEWISFLFLLSDLRHGGDRQLDAACPQGTLEDGSPDPLYNPRPNDVEVRWTDGQGGTRLAGCTSNVLLRTALKGALLVLGLDPGTGEKAER